MTQPDMLDYYRPVTPDMADEWHDHILPLIPERCAIGFKTLVSKVHQRIIDIAGNDSSSLDVWPRGSITNAILAMELQGEIIVGSKTIRQGYGRANAHNNV